jgi:hypothetical protein
MAERVARWNAVAAAWSTAGGGVGGGVEEDAEGGEVGSGCGVVVSEEGCVGLASGGFGLEPWIGRAFGALLAIPCPPGTDPTAAATAAMDTAGPGFLDGAAGISFALRASAGTAPPCTAWDACLLIA